MTKRTEEKILPLVGETETGKAGGLRAKPAEAAICVADVTRRSAQAEGWLQCTLRAVSHDAAFMAAPNAPWAEIRER